MTSGERMRNGENRERVEFSKGMKVLGAFAVVTASFAATGVMAYQGWQRGGERNPIVSTSTEVMAGESALTKFDSAFAETCRTAATIEVAGAGLKQTYRALNVPVAWDQVVIGMDLEKNLCLKGTTLENSLNPETGHLNVNVRQKSDITSRLTIVPGTFIDHVDFSGGYAQYQNLINTAKSTPLVQNLNVVKDGQANNDAHVSQMRNQVTIKAMEEASLRCNDLNVELALPEIEQAIKDVYIPGRTVEQLRHPQIKPDDISVTVEGVPIAEVTGIGRESNMTDSYNELVKYAQENGDFKFETGNLGECKTSDAIQRLLDSQLKGGAK